jgi:hypothetical protein
MRKVLALAITMASPGGGFYPANAGLIGMPMNLRAAIGQVSVDAAASVPVVRSRVCTFWTDDVVTGPLLVEGC